MGYNTEFTGKLNFTKDLLSEELTLLNSILGSDIRDHEEYTIRENLYGCPLYYIDLMVSNEFDGLEWNGAEKTYDMDYLINCVIIEMRKEFPDFTLDGEMLAQGEEFDDRYKIVISEEDGLAKRINIITNNDNVIVCPHCGEKIILGD